MVELERNDVEKDKKIMTLQEEVQKEKKEKAMLQNDLLKNSSVKNAMKAFEHNKVHEETMFQLACEVINTKGYKQTKLISFGTFGMVFSAMAPEDKKVAMKMSFCERGRLKASDNEIKILKKIKKWNDECTDAKSGLENIVEPLRFFPIAKLGTVVVMPFYSRTLQHTIG